jgi:hypothetical protein
MAAGRNRIPWLFKFTARSLERCYGDFEEVMVRLRHAGTDQPHLEAQSRKAEDGNGRPETAARLLDDWLTTTEIRHPEGAPERLLRFGVQLPVTMEEARRLRGT